VFDFFDFFDFSTLIFRSKRKITGAIVIIDVAIRVVRVVQLLLADDRRLTLLERLHAVRFGKHRLSLEESHSLLELDQSLFGDAVAGTVVGERATGVLLTLEGPCTALAPVQALQHLERGGAPGGVEEGGLGLLEGLVEDLRLQALDLVAQALDGGLVHRECTGVQDGFFVLRLGRGPLEEFIDSFYK